MSKEFRQNCGGFLGSFFIENAFFLITSTKSAMCYRVVIMATKEKVEGFREPAQTKDETSKKSSENYKDDLQRLQAEFENFFKRTEREKKDYKIILNAKLIESFLPLADAINEGINQGIKSNNKEMVEGFKRIHFQLIKILESNGVKAIESAGKNFDANIHECLMIENIPEKKDGEIIEEFQKGYVFHEKILRPAKVKVNKKESVIKNE